MIRRLFELLFRKYRTESLIALAAVAIAACWWPIRMRFPFDDTYITFRYAANLAHGYGIAWNPGSILHPVGAHTEGYTNFLLVLLLTPFVWLGCDLVIVSQVIGVIAVMVSAVAIYGIVDRRGQWHWSANGKERANAISPYGLGAASIFLLDPFIWMNAYSGLETSLFTMWLVVAIWAFITKRTELAFMLATFAALTRPEGALMGMVLLIVALIQKRQNPDEEIAATLEGHPPVSVLSYWVSAFVLPLAMYAGWKFWYFGNLLPNSFYVKVSQIAGGTFLPGRGTMRIFYTGVWYLLPFALIAAWKGPKNAGVQVAILWCCLLSAFYLFSQLIQNDYQRFTNSIEVLLLLLAGIAIGSMTKKRWVVRVAMTVLLAVNIVWSLFLRGGFGFIERTNEATSSYPHLAHVFRSIPDHKDLTLAWGDAGRLPYYSEVRSIDPVGLNTNEIAHARTAAEVVRYVIGAKPDLIVIPIVYPRDVPPGWNDSLNGSSARMILPRGQGLIGSAYPALARAALASTYKPIFMSPQPIYDIEFFADTTSVFYADILKIIVPLIGHDSDFLPPVTNIK
jgi:arabinofuranosyltransferase